MKRNSSKPKRRYGDAGFTLVELVVVIAVLAILAGVGAVAYSGYIEYTHKGVDRNTVGEIIHAIELANYDDPSLFEGGATVYITEGGVTSGNADVDTALERALGDLKSVKLTYKWDHMANMAGLTNLGTENSEIDKYLEMVEAPGGKAASFVDDIDDLWDSVGVSLEYMRGLGKDRNFMQDTLSYVNDQKTNILNTWKSGGGFDSTGGVANSASTALARNYAFAAYAKRQELTPEMQAELDAFMNMDLKAGGNAYGTFGSEQFTNNRGSIQAPSSLTESGWSDIIESYFNGGQAAADAQAYLAMMEAANAVGNTLGEDKSDDAFLDAMSKHLGTVKGALKDRNVLTKAISITGDFATITVNQNTDGTVTCSVNPNDEGLDPRDGNTVDGSGSTACGETHTETLSVKLDISQGFSGENNIELCSIENHVCTVSITLKNGGGVPQSNLLDMISVSGESGITIDQSNLKTGGTFTVTAKTSGKITITMATKSFEINVNVH